MLQNFRIVNAEGLKSLTIGGDTISLDKLTDAQAEKLLGKTHVLERVGEAPAAPVVAALPAGPPALGELPPAGDDDKKKVA